MYCLLKPSKCCPVKIEGDNLDFCAVKRASKDITGAGHLLPDD